MGVTVKKRGNQAFVRIPVAVLKAARIEIGDPVDVREEDGCIVVEPLRPSSYDLGDLVEGVTPDNLHEEIDFGPPVGKEGLPRS